MDSQSIMGCQVFRYRQRLHQSLWRQCCGITSAGCKRKGLHEYHPSLFSHRELTACLCSWGCKQLLEHPHGCSLGFSYTELLTWQRVLKNNCISTCAAQIYLDFDVSVQALSSLYGDYFLTLIKGRWKRGEFFDTCYALHHIYIPAVMQYLPINILTEFLVTVKKIRWNYQFANVTSENEAKVWFCTQTFIELVHAIIYASLCAPLQWQNGCQCFQQLLLMPDTI